MLIQTSLKGTNLTKQDIEKIFANYDMVKYFTLLKENIGALKKKKAKHIFKP